MYTLTSSQLDLIAIQLRKTQPHQALQAELLDHIASLIERKMAKGQPFAAAFEEVMQQANPQALGQLNRLYRQELNIRTSTALRSKRRPAAKPLQYILLASVLAFFILTGCVAFISRSMDMPIRSVQIAWGMGLTGITAVLLMQWGLARKFPKTKRLRTT